MLKFVKGHLESIDGVEIYPLISLSIFFLFFSILLWWVVTARKEHIKEISNYPLDTTEDQHHWNANPNQNLS